MLPVILSAPVLLCLAAAPAGPNPFRGTAWLRDPVFRGVETIDIYHKQKSDPPELSGPKNVHTFFRKEIDLPTRVASATLYVTGDDYYKLYINSRFVVQGPESGYPFAHPYYALDVTDRLRPGPNALAAHAYY